VSKPASKASAESSPTVDEVTHPWSSPVSEVRSELHHLPTEEVAHLCKLARLRGSSMRLPPPSRRSPTRANQLVTEAGVEPPLIINEVTHPREIARL
jgi:hypothetical protein